MQDVMDVLKALSDESRVRILLSLTKGELCVCQLIELLQLSPSTVSKHLSILRSARLVESRKDGRWIYYQLTKASRFPLQARLLRQVEAALANSSQAVADRLRLGVIQSMDAEELCRQMVSKK